MSREILPAKSDIVFKMLFGDERNIDLLTDLLKSVLDLPSDEYDVVTIVDPHLLRDFGDDKLGILDVKVKTKSGKAIDIEIQVAPVPELKERIIFYNSKMVTEQIGDGDNYRNIKKVISIIITNFDYIDDSDFYHNDYTLYDSKTKSRFTNLVEIHTLELSKLPNADDGTELWDWLTFLKAETKEELEMVAQTNPQIKKAVGVLQILSADERTRMLYESLEKARRDEESRLYGALQERDIEIAKALLAMGDGVDKIEKVTNLPREEIEKLRTQL
ncbi:hypothetical protein AGMMS49975_18720 [Clostridia bacterium]|nr:hypothetical protein AGMMS49975_18720 [Clostridia bacterium]